MNTPTPAPHWQQQPIPFLTICPICGGDLLGDGYYIVIHCENVYDESVLSAEPDANPIYCEENKMLNQPPRLARYTEPGKEPNECWVHGFFQVCNGPNDSSPVGLVEFSDGTITTVFPDYITFLENPNV